MFINYCKEIALSYPMDTGGSYPR